MPVTVSSPVGLVAGSGSFPLQFVESARKRGLEVVVCAHEGETDPEIERLVPHCTWIRVGQLGKIIRVMKRAGVKEVAFVGGISRVRLFGGVRLDLRGLQLLARIRSVRDDVLLRGIASELESSGLRVISPAVILDRSLAREGVLTRRALTSEEHANALVGWEVAKRIGSGDVGQTIVMNGGLVVAVEAVEGTDATIRRAGSLAGKGSVVVKVGKPDQDTRLDIPALGIQTIETMGASGATALILEDQMALVLDPARTIGAAEQLGISIVVWRSPAASNQRAMDSVTTILR